MVVILVAVGAFLLQLPNETSFDAWVLGQDCFVLGLKSAAMVFGLGGWALSQGFASFARLASFHH